MFNWPLTPPRQGTLLLSLILAIFACLVHWLHIAVPPFSTGFVVLVLGSVLLRGADVPPALAGPLNPWLRPIFG